MGAPFTHGRWKVKAGREGEFARAWLEMAIWTATEDLGSISARLLRDVGDPSTFLSFGEWKSLEAIEQWRGHSGFQERMDRVRKLVDSVEVMTLELVAEES